MRHNKVFPRNKPGTEEAYILQLVCHVYLPAGGRQKELQLLTDPQQRKHPRPPVEEQTCAQYQRRKCYRELIDLGSMSFCITGSGSDFPLG